MGMGGLKHPPPPPLLFFPPGFLSPFALALVLGGTRGGSCRTRDFKRACRRDAQNHRGRKNSPFFPPGPPRPPSPGRVAEVAVPPPQTAPHSALTPPSSGSAAERRGRGGGRPCPWRPRCPPCACCSCWGRGVSTAAGGGWFGGSGGHVCFIGVTAARDARWDPGSLQCHGGTFGFSRCRASFGGGVGELGPTCVSSHPWHRAGGVPCAHGGLGPGLGTSGRGWGPVARLPSPDRNAGSEEKRGRSSATTRRVRSPRPPNPSSGGPRGCSSHPGNQPRGAGGAASRLPIPVARHPSIPTARHGGAGTAPAHGGDGGTIHGRLALPSYQQGC